MNRRDALRAMLLGAATVAAVPAVVEPAEAAPVEPAPKSGGILQGEWVRKAVASGEIPVGTSLYAVPDGNYGGILVKDCYVIVHPNSDGSWPSRPDVPGPVMWS